MAVGAGLEQSLKQKMTVDAGQIERLEILSMGTVELETFVNEEQMSNPVLELESDPGNTESLDKYLQSGRYSSETGISGEDEKKVLDIPDRAVENLHEYLISQLPASRIDRRQALLLIRVIQYIDEDTGYFSVTEEAMLEELSCTKKELDAAVFMIRELEPSGVGAWNLPDCLLLQLNRKRKNTPLLEKLITEHLEEVGKGNVSALSKTLGVSAKKIKEALQMIRALNPRPVQAFGEEETTYIVPDIEADYQDGEWNVRIQKPASAFCNLNQKYLRMLRETKDTELIAYLNEKINRARQIREAIESRDQMIRIMMLYLLEHQTEFALGRGKKVRLTQKSVADMLGVHPSTVNRAAKNKYVRVPSGVFPLKDFFQSGKTGQEKVQWDSSDRHSADSFRNTSEKEYQQPKRVSEICLIAPTEELIRQNDRICSLYDKKVDARLASVANAPEIVKELQEKGAEIFISRKGTKKVIEAQAVPIVEIGLSVTDYIPLLQKAAQIEGKVAFFSYGVIPEDVRSICTLLSIDALFYSFYKAGQCKKLVQEAMKDGAVLGIGGADSALAAREFGLEHLVVENSDSSLLIAIESAEQLLELKRIEEEKQEALKIRLERYEAVFNFTHDAIIAVNEKGEVDVLNKGAESLLKAHKKSYIGLPIRDLLPNTKIPEVLQSGKNELNQLMNIKGTMVSTNRVPIIVDGKVKGAVATFQDVQTIQKNERRIRVKMHDKGLRAKYHFDDIVGKSVAIQDNIRMAGKFAASNATILILGETGTGKELFAQSVHNASHRADGPFVAVNCGSLPQNILEAELFGYVEGAFTGARKGGKIGLFELAHGGTIFLDEIGEMPLETQVQLLRVLQEKEIRRVGSDTVTPIDIRVITATNRDLIAEIRQKRFREDLYYRLNVLNLKLPPLRNRKEDVEEIALNIYQQFTVIDSEERHMLCNLLHQIRDYDWPGNVREVHNLMERIYVLRSQGEDFGFILQYITGYMISNQNTADVSTSDHVEEASIYEEKHPPKQRGGDLGDWEKQRIILALKENHLEIATTARALGMSRSTLWRRLKKYGIQI